MDITICLWILAALHFLVGVICGANFFLELTNDKEIDKDELSMYFFFGAYGFFVWWVLLQAITVIDILLP